MNLYSEGPAAGIMKFEVQDCGREQIIWAPGIPDGDFITLVGFWSVYHRNVGEIYRLDGVEILKVWWN